MIYCLGVVHHTPDPALTFDRLVEALGPNGVLTVWVYGAENNGWITRLVSPLRRQVTSKLPHRLLRLLSKLLVLPLYGLAAAATRVPLPYSEYLRYLRRYPYRYMTHIVYDHLVPEIAHYLPRAELDRWVEKHGLHAQVSSRNGNSWRLLASRLAEALPVALRAAGFAFGVLNIDESDFLVFGAGLWKGLLPYRDLVEIKPPLGYLTYALAGGISIWPIRVLGVLWVFATAQVLRATARTWTGSDEAGWAAAWLSLLAGLVEVPSFGSELMMGLPTALALLFFARGNRAAQPLRGLGVPQQIPSATRGLARGPTPFAWGNMLACGVCIGLASLYRHQGAIAAVALGLALLWEARREPARSLLQMAVLALGTVLPWGAAAGAWAALGQLDQFAEWTIWRNLAYAGQSSALLRGAWVTVVCLAASAALG